MNSVWSFLVNLILPVTKLIGGYIPQVVEALKK